MEIDDPKIVALQEKVTAAQQEFDMAVTFHEVWKPAAYDQDLPAAWGNPMLPRPFSSLGPPFDARCCSR
jgi:hypothetical protein